jgi:hypothetical protein
MLEGRMINVELTAGGGGKSEKRMEKLRERNKELLGQRVSLVFFFIFIAKSATLTLVL